MRDKSLCCGLGASLCWTNATLYDKDGRLTFRRVGVTDPRGVRSSIPRCKTCCRLKKDKRVLAKEALKALLQTGNLGNPLISTVMLQVLYWFSCPCVVHLRPTVLLLFMFPSYHSPVPLGQTFLPPSDRSHIYAFKSLFVRRYYVVQQQL